jgi:hypothetical protein
VLLVASLAMYALGWWMLEHWSATTGQAFFGDDQVQKTLHGDASSSRGKIWANTLEMIAAHPWRGVGTAAFNYDWTMGVFPERPIAFFDHSHNLELQLAVENGIPFAVIVCAALLWALWAGRAALTSTDDRRVLGARTALFMLVLVAVHSQLEYPLWYTYFLLPTCILAGWYAGLARLAAHKSDVIPQAAAGAGSRRVDQPWSPERTAAESRPGVRGRLHAALAGLHSRFALALGGVALAASAWALVEYWMVAVVFEPRLAIGEPGALEQRIQRARRSVLFGHHADYADVTMAEHPETMLPQFTRPLYHLLDTRLMMAYAKALAAADQIPAAVHVAARLREFHNPASDEFFEPCISGGHPLPFQCATDPRLTVDEMRAVQQR